MFMQNFDFVQTRAVLIGDFSLGSSDGSIEYVSIVLFSVFQVEG
jgi:hypothetical protein